MNVIGKSAKFDNINCLYRLKKASIKVCIGLIFTTFFVSTISAQLVHPGGYLREADLERIRTNVAAGLEPWASAWADLKASGYDTSYEPSGLSSTITSEKAMVYHAHAAWMLTIMWVASGESKYADHAIYIINEWVNTVDVIDCPQAPLRIGEAGNQMANAAEILAHGFNGEANWSSTEINNAKTWFEEVVWPKVGTGGLRSSNHGTSALSACMSIAIFCDNTTFFNYAVEAYKYGFTDSDDGCCGLTQYIWNESGQCNESGRDQAHPQGGIGHLLETAYMAWIQGVNIANYGNNRLFAGLEYLAKYNLGNEVSWDFGPMPDECDVHPDSYNDGISTANRGDFSPIYEMAVKLAKVVGVSTPYCSQVLSSDGYQPEHSGNAIVGLGTLLYQGAKDSLYIEAENYSDMSGITVEETGDVSGTSNITEINTEDWLEYEIFAPFSTTYTIEYRVASESNNVDFEVMADNNVIDQVSFENTGGGQSWKTVSSTLPVYLNKGVQTLRITAKNDGWKINWLKIKAIGKVEKCELPKGFDGFVIKDTTVNWTSGAIDISCENQVDVHVLTESDGSLGDADYLNIYYRLDNGEMIPIAENTGFVDEDRFNITNIAGSTLEISVQSRSESTDASYTISRIDVSKTRDPFAKIEAEDYDNAYGTKIESCSDTGGGENIGSIRNGHWVMYRNLSLSEVRSIRTRLAGKNSGCTLEVRLDTESGQLIGTIDIPQTGDWQEWETVSVNLDSTAGFHDVYFIFRTSGTWVASFNWFQFTPTIIEEPNSVKVIDKIQNFNIYPNPFNTTLTIAGNRGARIEIFNLTGKKVIVETLESDTHVIDVEGLNAGMYLGRINKNGSITCYKLIKN